MLEETGRLCGYGLVSNKENMRGSNPRPWYGARPSRFRSLFTDTPEWCLQHCEGLPSFQKQMFMETVSVDRSQQLPEN